MRRHVPCLPIRGVFSQQAADTIDWTVRCDWLQVASSRVKLYAHNIVLMRSASVVELVASFILVVIRVLVDYMKWAGNSTSLTVD